MNVVLWVVAGGLAAWIACSLLRLNVHRGFVISACIGIAGAFFGGYVLAPVFGTVDDTGGFNLVALFMAFVSALATMTISDMMYRHFRI
jgi:uncharacterized membrane protein YeaQ/YmgE (transglycosylase-associated protein family)